MHLKNFSLLTGHEDEVRMFPACDLLSTRLLIKEDKEEMALTLNGEIGFRLIENEMTRYCHYERNEVE